VKKLIATFGGIGMIPGMPGTYASFAAALVFYIAWRAMGADVRFVIAGLTLLAVAIAPAGWKWAHENFKSADPRQYVLDEVIGQWIALLCIPLEGPVPAYVAGAFFLFRGFDIAKPWPIRRIEAIKGCWGAILDDVAAGVFSVAGFWLLNFAVRALAGG